MGKAFISSALLKLGNNSLVRQEVSLHLDWKLGMDQVCLLQNQKNFINQNLLRVLVYTMMVSQLNQMNITIISHSDIFVFTESSRIHLTKFLTPTQISYRLHIVQQRSRLVYPVYLWLCILCILSTTSPHTPMVILVLHLCGYEFTYTYVYMHILCMCQKSFYDCSKYLKSSTF